MVTCGRSSKSVSIPQACALEEPLAEKLSGVVHGALPELL